MKRMFVGLMSAALSLPLAAEDTGFELVREENGIKVLRQLNEDQGVFRVKVETLAKEPIHGMLKMNTEPDQWPHWMPKVTHAEFIKPGEDHYTVYIQYESPWPVQNRESVTEARVSKDNATGTVRLSFHTVESNRPIADDHTRIPTIKGEWVFTPQDDQTLIEYDVLVDPGGSVPKWMVNMESVEIPYQTVVNMLANMPKYRNVHLDWL